MCVDSRKKVVVLLSAGGDLRSMLFVGRTTAKAMGMVKTKERDFQRVDRWMFFLVVLLSFFS